MRKAVRDTKRQSQEPGRTLGLGADALGPGGRDPPQTNVRIKVSAGRSGDTKTKCFLAICDPPDTSIPFQRGAHSN